MTQSTTLPPTPHYSTLYKKSQVLTEKSIKQLTEKSSSLIKTLKNIKTINSAKETIIKTIISAKGATNV